MKTKISIILPVYNEEPGIKYFHEYLLKHIQELKACDRYSFIEFCLIYVLDKCTDNSTAILEELAQSGSGISVITMSSRFGHQQCILAGLEYGISKSSDCFVMMDSDLQHPPEILGPMIDAYLAGNDIVYTVRVDTEKIGFLRKSVGNLFYWLINKLSETYINPNSSDFRLISLKVAKTLTTNINERNIFLRGIFSWMGFRTASIEYVANARAYGHSKYSIASLFGLAASGVISFSTKPLRIGIDIGIFFAVLAFLMGLYAIADYFVDKNIPSGWTTLAVLLLFFSGLQLIMIGIVGIYIGGIHKEVKNRPHYIIDRITASDSQYLRD